MMMECEEDELFITLILHSLPQSSSHPHFPACFYKVLMAPAILCLSSLLLQVDVIDDWRVAMLWCAVLLGWMFAQGHGLPQAWLPHMGFRCPWSQRPYQCCCEQMDESGTPPHDKPSDQQGHAGWGCSRVALDPGLFISDTLRGEMTLGSSPQPC